MYERNYQKGLKKKNQNNVERENTKINTQKKKPQSELRKNFESPKESIIRT